MCHVQLLAAAAAAAGGYEKLVECGEKQAAQYALFALFFLFFLSEPSIFFLELTSRLVHRLQYGSVRNPYLTR